MAVLLFPKTLYNDLSKVGALPIGAQPVPDPVNPVPVAPQQDLSQRMGELPLVAPMNQISQQVQTPTQLPAQLPLIQGNLQAPARVQPVVQSTPDLIQRMAERPAMEPEKPAERGRRVIRQSTQSPFVYTPEQTSLKNKMAFRRIYRGGRVVNM